MATQRTYKINLEKSRTNATPESIRRAKNSRCKARRTEYLQQQAILIGERNAAYNKLTPTEKLQRLDWRFGKNLGAVKTRKKLQKLIDEECRQHGCYESN